MLPSPWKGLGSAVRLRPGMKPAEAAPCPNQFEPAVGRSRANPLELPLAPKWGSELQRV